MDKVQLLKELILHTYVMLKPSAIHGIGIFAIRDIPLGCRNMFSETDEEWHSLNADEMKHLPSHVKNLIETYCLFDEEHYFVPAKGFKVMDLSLFLNHSDTPNIISINDGEFFETTRHIHAGEELFIDYGTIVESEE
ncbi:MAG: SET domain-containing protein [Bacteroidota bacterium]|nr:SET domain-containing protein [Bacteroidota bacterium]